MNGVLIQGRKGDEGRTPVEARDTLRTTQIGEVIDLISEGECEGLANGLKDYFLDGVPVENEDGTKNFEVEFSYNVGTVGQAALPGMTGVMTEHPVGVQVLKAAPIVRSISSPDVDLARITIGVPQLSAQDPSTGDLHGSSFTFAIDVQSNGGGFVQRYVRTVSDKTMSLATLSIDVKLSGSAPHEIRVRRISDDSSSSNVVNGFSWMTYTEVISRKLRYPNSAVALTRFNAQQFGRFPARSWRWRGVKVLVPSNYDPITRAYTGTWDGTFIRRWTNNPAWLFNAVVTNERWGLGRYVDQALQNKWTLYKIGQYCDGLVPDGFGGMEPRFTCNWTFTTRVEAYRVLQDLAAVFRTMVFWGNAGVQYSQDAPQQPRLLYTPANVVDGVFTTQDVSEKTLHSVFICYWQDMSQQGKRVPEILSDDTLIERYGVRELVIESIACTSRGQAARMNRWARHSEQMQGELKSFRVGADGEAASLGEVFLIHDPEETGDQLGGRIKSATTGQVVLDRQIELHAGEDYTVVVMLPDPDDSMKLVTQERTVINPAGVTNTLTVAPSFSQAPHAESVWIVQSNAVKATTWRCLSNKPVDGSNEHEILGIAHNPGKFDAIELGLVLDVPPISRITAKVLPPTNLQLLETVYTDGTINKSRLTASWLPSAPHLDHFVSWRKDTGWWQALPRTSNQTIDIGNLDPGVYEVIVRSINPLGTISMHAQASITLQGGPSGVRAVRLQASSLTFKVPNVGGVSPTQIEFQADLGALAGPATWAVVDGDAELAGTGLTRSLAYSDMHSEVATVSVTVEDAGQTFVDMVSIFKVRDGLPGEPGQDGDPGGDGDPGTPATAAMLSLDVIALPADGDGAVTSYTGAFTTLVIWAGDEVDAAGWTYTRVNSSPDLATSLAGATLTVTSMAIALDSAYVDITATRSGSTSITKRVSIVKAKRGVPGTAGDPGPRGSVQLAHATSSTSWSDSEANLALVDAGYSGPANLDVVTLYNNDVEPRFSEARVFSLGSWLPIAAYIHGNLLVRGTVAADALNVSKLSAIAAACGTLTVDESISGGQTAFNTGSGFWLGKDTDGIYKLSIGSLASGLKWDGETLKVFGDLDSAGGTFSGKLTVDAIDAVETVNIANNAVIIPAGVRTFAPVGSGLVASVTIDAKGGRIFATFTGIIVIGSHSGSLWTVAVGLYINDVLCAETSISSNGTASEQRILQAITDQPIEGEAVIEVRKSGHPGSVLAGAVLSVLGCRKTE